MQSVACFLNDQQVMTRRSVSEGRGRCYSLISPRQTRSWSAVQPTIHKWSVETQIISDNCMHDLAHVGLQRNSIPPGTLSA